MKWLINKNKDSDNYLRHYCQSCGAYSVFSTDHPEYFDQITAFCPHCGQRLEEAELIDGTFTSVPQVYTAINR